MRSKQPICEDSPVSPYERLRSRAYSTVFAVGIVLAAFLPLLYSPSARASVAVLLEEPYGGMNVLNPTGHSAIYLDHVCAETPLVLRVCRPGELGAVISRYDDIDGYDWLAMPLLPYLYSVERPEDIPASVDAIAVDRLRNQYRRAHLNVIAPDSERGELPRGNWYELMGAAYDRTVYGFQVDSTAEQDQRIVALLNDRQNIQRYNGAFRNCADFSRVIVNRYYPHAVRRNFIADLGLTTPKSVARGLTLYAAKHPEANLKVFVVPQVRGSLPRSHRPQGVAESLLTRYGVPLTLISPVVTGVVFVAYLGHGRFRLPESPSVLHLGAPVEIATGSPEALVRTAAAVPAVSAASGLLSLPSPFLSGSEAAAPLEPLPSTGFPIGLGTPVLDAPLLQ